MSKFRVHIRDVNYGYWEIEAEDIDKAKEEANKRLMDGDTSWQESKEFKGGVSGSIDIDEVEKLS